MTLEETRKRILEDDEFVMSEVAKLRYIYKLKKEIRYAQKREEVLDTESVAEHIFGMHVLANYFLPLEDIEGKLDKLKILETITWHDIDEIETGDIVVHHKTTADIEREREILPQVITNFPDHLQEIVTLRLNEYEKRESLETKFVKAIDKIEPVFEIWGEGYKQILHQINTTWDAHWQTKEPYLKHFPYIERFGLVTRIRLRDNGYFVS